MRPSLWLRAGLVALLTSAIALASGGAAQAALAPPAIFGVVPTSPGASLTPTFYGTAAASVTVTLYGNAACAGSPIGSGTTDADGHWLISVPVAPGATVDAYGTAVGVGLPSPCSTTHAAYTALVPPDTTITKHPAAKVKTPARKATVSFSFRSTVSPAMFVCTIDGSLQTCASTETFTLKRGAHTLSVAAFDAATFARDQTPAEFSFTIKKKRGRG